MIADFHKLREFLEEDGCLTILTTATGKKIGLFEHTDSVWIELPITRRKVLDALDTLQKSINRDLDDLREYIKIGKTISKE